MSGYYKILPFFLSRVICDILLLRIVPPMLFCITSYFMMGFGGSISQFFIFLLTNIVANLCGSALGFCVSATIPILGKTELSIDYSCDEQSHSRRGCRYINFYFGSHVALRWICC